MANTVSATIRINDAFSGSLNKLQSGLSKSSSVMSKFKSALSGGMNSKMPNKMAGGFNNLNGQVTKTGGLFKTMLGANVVGAGVTKGISMITSNLDSAIQRVDTLNNATRSFQNMGFSAKQTASAMGFLDKSITGLPTSMDSAVRNTQLLAASTNNIGKSTKIYKAMNDGILGFGGSANQVDTAVTQLSQAFSNGKIDMATWNSMINGGMGPALNSIAKTMDMTTGQLKSGLSTGKVSVKDFQDALIKLDEVGGGGLKSLGKIAQDSTKGLGTSMTNFSTAVVRAMASVLDALADAGLTNFINQMTNGIKAGIPKIVSMMKEIVTAIVPILEGASKAVDSFFKSFADSGAFTAVGKALGSIGNTIGSVFSKLSSGGGKDPFAMFKTLGSITGGAISGLAKGLGSIADVVGNLNPGTIKLLGAAFVALKMGTKGLVLTAVVAGLNALNKLSPGTLNALAKAITVLAVGLLVLKTVGKIGGILSSVSSGIGALSKGGGLAQVGQSATTAAAGFIKLGVSLLLVGGAILLAGAGFYLLANAALKLVAAGWPAVALFFGMIVAIAALAAVAALLGPALIVGSVGFIMFGAALMLISIAILIAAAGLSLLATQLPIIAIFGMQAALSIVLLGGAIAIFGVLAIVAAVGLILLGASLLIVGVSLIIAAVGALLFGAAMLIVSVGVMIAAVGIMILAVALPIIAAFTLIAAVGMIMFGVGLVVVAAVALLAGMGLIILGVALAIIAPLSMIAAVGIMLLGVAAIVAAAGILAIGVAIMAAAAALSMLGAAIQSLVSAFVSAMAGMVSAVTSGMASVVSAVTSGISSAVSAARSFTGALVSVGAQLIQGLVNGIKSMIGAAVSAVTSVASSVVNAAKSILHIGSPSKLFNQYGQWVVQGLANGLNANNNAELASASMAKGVVEAASGLNNMPTMNPGDILANGFDRALSSISQIGAIMQRLTGSQMAVNGQVNTSVAGSITTPLSSDTPSSTPFNNSNTPYGNTESSSTVQSTNDNSQANVSFAQGAIQIQSTGNADYDAETLVAKIEDYLMNVNERRG